MDIAILALYNQPALATPNEPRIELNCSLARLTRDEKRYQFYISVQFFFLFLKPNIYTFIEYTNTFHLLQ